MRTLLIIAIGAGFLLSGTTTVDARGYHRRYSHRTYYVHKHHRYYYPRETVIYHRPHYYYYSDDYRVYHGRRIHRLYRPGVSIHIRP